MRVGDREGTSRPALHVVPLGRAVTARREALKWGTGTIRLTRDMEKAIRRNVPDGERFTPFMRKVILRAIDYPGIE